MNIFFQQTLFIDGQTENNMLEGKEILAAMIPHRCLLHAARVHSFNQSINVAFQMSSLTTIPIWRGRKTFKN